MTSRARLMIPGPIELPTETLEALGAPGPSHLDLEFVETFGRALERTRAAFLSESAQPFLIAGSGTLAMEIAAYALLEPGQSVLMIETGFFSERLSKQLERLGAEVVRLSAEPGHAPSLDEVARTLATRRFDVVAMTHVDTSTGVRADVEGVATLAREHGALTLVDGVCSAFGEALEQDAWGIDAFLTASQKALAGPPGLAIVSLSQRVLERLRRRSWRVPSLYLDALEWLPVMEAYEARRAAYFATPPVHVVRAVGSALERVENEGVAARVERHRAVAEAFRSGLRSRGMKLVADDLLASNTISGVFYPEDVDARLISAIRNEGFVIAGGLHPKIAAKYFRVGHMGETRVEDIEVFFAALDRAVDVVRSS